MAAAGRGNISVVEELVSMGADLEVRAANGWTARDIAVYRNQDEAVSLIESIMKTAQSSQAQSPVEAGMEIHEVRLKSCIAQNSTKRSTSYRVGSEINARSWPAIRAPTQPQRCINTYGKHVTTMGSLRCPRGPLAL